MDRKKIILFSAILGLILTGCNSFGGKLLYYNSAYPLKKVNRVIYFQPSVFPEIEEIKHPTNQAFFSAVTEEMDNYNNVKTIIINQSLNYANTDTEYIKSIGVNNNAEVIIVPSVRYFKVGFGKYVFSNQVLVSLKLYNQKGNLVMEMQYDTYKGKARLTGKAENSVKIGTKEVLKNLILNLRKKKML